VKEERPARGGRALAGLLMRLRKQLNFIIIFLKTNVQTFVRHIHNQLSALFNHAVRFYGLKVNPAATLGLRILFWILAGVYLFVLLKFALEYFDFRNRSKGE